MIAPASAVRAEEDRSALLLVVAAIVTLPVLQPTGPGRFTPADVMMAVAVIGTVVWAGTHGIVVRFPYLLSMGTMVVAGFVASLFSPDLDRSALALVQDAFLLAWGIAVANVIRTPRDLSLILRAWAWASTVWAWLLIVSSVVGVSGFLGATTGADTRGKLWFDEPNMAGQYFALSFFVILLGRYPTSRPIRVLAGLSVLWALLLTGSNGALLSLAAGCAVMAFVAVWRRTDLVVALANGVLILVLVVGLASVAINSSVLTRVEEGPPTIVERSIARSPKSAAGRASLFQTEIELFRSATPLGIGPASTKDILEAEFDLSKGGHSDYLATLVERGVLGVVGLVLLTGSLAVMAYALAFRPLAPGFARELVRPSAVAGALVAHALYAITHETLHYRYLWAFFGIVAGIYLFGRETRPIPAVGDPPVMRGAHATV